MKKIIIIITTLFLLVVSCGKVNKTKEKELRDITFVLDWTPNTNHTGIYVAKEKGIFEKYGLNVNIVQPSEDSASSIVGSGRAEFGVYFQPNMIGKLKRGMPIKAIAAILQHNTAGLMTLKSFNTNSPKDLENLKYASWEDPIDDATVKDIVGENIKRVPYGEITDPLAAMQYGVFDYLISYYAWDGINAEIKKVPINFYFFKDYNKNLDYYTPVIISNNNFLKENPKIVKNFLKAAREGYEFAINNPEEAAEILIKNAPESSPELIMASQKWISKQYKGNATVWGVFNIDRWDNFYNWLYEKKLIDNKLPSSYGVTNDYIKD